MYVSLDVCYGHLWQASLFLVCDVKCILIGTPPSILSTYTSHPHILLYIKGKGGVLCQPQHLNNPRITITSGMIVKGCIDLTLLSVYFANHNTREEDGWTHLTLFIFLYCFACVVSYELIVIQRQVFVQRQVMQRANLHAEVTPLSLIFSFSLSLTHTYL